MKKCSRCGIQIECKSYNIKSCECSEISLIKEEIEFIHLKYQDCLCNKCLMEMKDEFQMTVSS